jgi:ankyrin repeat protein
MNLKIKKALSIFTMYQILSISLGFGAVLPPAEPESYKYYFHVSEDLSREAPNYLFSKYYPEDAQQLTNWLTQKGITANFINREISEIIKNYPAARKSLCQKFIDAGFKIFKGTKDNDQTLVAAFPEKSPFNQYVFKMAIEEINRQDNIIRTIWARSINERLHSKNITYIKAPEKYLIQLPGAAQIFDNGNYAVLCEKINITKVRGGVFDTITPEQLEVFVKEIVIYFGMFDLHVDYGDIYTSGRNVVYDKNAGKIILIDTDPLFYQIKNYKIDFTNPEDLDNNLHFERLKKVIPLELLTSKWILYQNTKNIPNEIKNIAQDLCFWIFTISLGIIETYRYYNFDDISNQNPPQTDTKKFYPHDHFDWNDFSEHRKVLSKWGYFCMLNIIKCREAIEKIYPNIKQQVETYFKIQQPSKPYPYPYNTEKGNIGPFIVVPIEKFFYYTTRAPAKKDPVLSIREGLKFPDLEKNFGQDFESFFTKGSTILHIAVENGDLGFVRCLVEVDKANINLTNKDGKTPEQFAKSKGQIQIAEYLSLIQNLQNATKQIISTTQVKPLLEKASKYPDLLDTSIFDPNNNLALIIIAADQDNLDMIKLLLNLGANVNSADSEGFTALHSAAQNQNLEIIKLLISNNASVNAQDSRGFIPLHLSVQTKQTNPQIIEYLINNKTEINSNNNANRATPLHLAAYFGNMSAVQSLVDYGARLDLVDNQKKTPEMLAREKGYLDIADFLANARQSKKQTIIPQHISQKENHD